MKPVTASAALHSESAQSANDPCAPQPAPGSTATASPGVPDESRRLRDAFGAFATGVTIVTTHAADGPQGMTVNSFSSVSLEPALILWSVAHSSARCRLFAEAEYFAVNVLSEQQSPMALAFARNGSVFDSYPWKASEFNSPVLSGCVATFECRKYTCHAAGDHTIVIGEVQRATLSSGNPLLFHRGKFRTIQQQTDDKTTS